VLLMGVALDPELDRNIEDRKWERNR